MTVNSSHLIRDKKMKMFNKLCIFYNSNLVPTPNYNYANSISNYYVIMMVRRLKKFIIQNFQYFLISDARSA